MDIITGEFFVNLDCYFPCHLLISLTGGDGINEGGMVGIVIIARYNLHFIRVHDILVYDPSINNSLLANRSYLGAMLLKTIRSDQE